MGEKRRQIEAAVIADSTSRGSRLTTFEVTIPRFILSEFNTHRVLSRNSASSRAIPVWKRLLEVIDHPFIPLSFGKNRAGMQSSEEVVGEDNDAARHNWLVGRDTAVIQAFVLAGGVSQIKKDAKGNPDVTWLCLKVQGLFEQYPDVFDRLWAMSAGVHKQHANRVLEPYAWHTIIFTGSYWRNFYALRASTKAQPEIQALAIEMAKAHSQSFPVHLRSGEWHLPYIFAEDREEQEEGTVLARISSARCARVSYLTHDGKRSLDKDLSLADELQKNGHTSPFEHPATPTPSHIPGCRSNFGPAWTQYRKFLPNEDDFSRIADSGDLTLGMKGDEELCNFVRSLPE